MKTYNLKILDLERTLPILKTNNGIEIAGFNPVGDMELLIKSGKYLSKQIMLNNIKFDIILTTELKGLPIAQEVARNLNCDYVCLRKEKKCYLENPVHIEGESITSGKTNYYLSLADFNKLKNKNVLFVDDVFSTGSTFQHILESFNNNFKITAALCILKEGKENKEINFIYKDVPIYCCGFLPLP